MTLLLKALINAILLNNKFVQFDVYTMRYGYNAVNFLPIPYVEPARETTGLLFWCQYSVICYIVVYRTTL